MNKKKIIVFGATGTIGAYTCIDLAHKYEIIALGHRKSDNGFFADFGIPYYSVDIRQTINLDNLARENIYAIVHLAGSIPARMKGYEPQEYIDSIVTGTLNVLDFAVKCNANRFIFTQSISDVSYLCDRPTSFIPSDVTSKFPLNNDHSVYSICKTCAVNLIEHYFNKYGLKRFILRLPNIYLFHPIPIYYLDGIEKWQNYRLLIEKAIHSEPIEIWGDPTRYRDIVYVKDCLQMIQRSIDAEHSDGGLYNVGTGIGTSLQDQIKGIIQVFSPSDNPSTIIYKPHMPDSTQYIFDISKPQRELGYRPQYDYLSYLQDMKKEMSLNRFEKLWGKK